MWSRRKSIDSRICETLILLTGLWLSFCIRQTDQGAHVTSSAMWPYLRHLIPLSTSIPAHWISVSDRPLTHRATVVAKEEHTYAKIVKLPNEPSRYLR